MNTIRFTIEEGCTAPVRKHAGDAGWDLFISRRVVIPPKAYKDIPTGLNIELPDNLWARITGRSSAVRTLNLVVQEGIIDSGYRGTMHVGAWNMGDNPVVLEVGDRIAQLTLHEHVSVQWEQVEELSPSDRGTNGFGSTGR